MDKISKIKMLKYASLGLLTSELFGKLSDFEMSGYIHIYMYLHGHI